MEEQVTNYLQSVLMDLNETTENRLKSAQMLLDYQHDQDINKLFANEDDDGGTDIKGVWL
jgi:hypothetical protein